MRIPETGEPYAEVHLSTVAELVEALDPGTERDSNPLDPPWVFHSIRAHQQRAAILTGTIANTK